MRSPRASRGAEVLNTLSEVVGLRVGVHRVERHEAVEAEVKRRVIKQQSKVFVSAHESICNENITWIRRMLIKGEGNFGGLLCFCRAVVLLVS